MWKKHNLKGLEENIGKCLYEFGSGRGLFNPVQNTQTIKGRSENIDIKSLI